MRKGNAPMKPDKKTVEFNGYASRIFGLRLISPHRDAYRHKFRRIRNGMTVWRFLLSYEFGSPTCYLYCEFARKHFFYQSDFFSSCIPLHDRIIWKYSSNIMSRSKFQDFANNAGHIPRRRPELNSTKYFCKSATGKKNLDHLVLFDRRSWISCFQLEYLPRAIFGRSYVGHTRRAIH